MSECIETSKQRVARLLDEFISALQNDQRTPLLSFLQHCHSDQEKDELADAAIPAALLVSEANMARRHRLTPDLSFAN